MQIDLLIDRADDVVNVCEMKYSKSQFVVTKSYAEKLLKRQTAVENMLQDKSIHLTLISFNGIERNKLSEIFTLTITSDDLFR